MGVKEYRFLTKTMKTISARSNKLEKANRLLTKTDNSLKDTRSSARSVRAKVKRTEASKQRDEYDSSHRSEWGSLSSLRKEIIVAKSELKSAKEKEFWEDGPRWFSLILLYCFVLLPFSVILWMQAARHYIYSPTLEVVALLLALVIPFFPIRAIENHARKRRLSTSEFQSNLDVLMYRKRALDREEKEIRQANSKLRNLEKELSWMESGIEDSVKLRDSTKKEIKLLEKEISQLWDSIAHLIPFSTALEKA